MDLSLEAVRNASQTESWRVTRSFLSTGEKAGILGGWSSMVRGGEILEPDIHGRDQHLLSPVITWILLTWEYGRFRVFLGAQMVKNLPATQETWVRSLGQENPLEKGMAVHSSILAWEIPQTEELGGLQFMGLKESDATEHAGRHAHTWVLGEMSPQDIPQLLVTWGCLLPSTLCWLVSRCSFYLINSLQKHIQPSAVVTEALTASH